MIDIEEHRRALQAPTKDVAALCEQVIRILEEVVHQQQRLQRRKPDSEVEDLEELKKHARSLRDIVPLSRLGLDKLEQIESIQREVDGNDKGKQ